MRESHFSILLVEEVRPHNGIVVNDLLYNQKELLIDRALSKTVAPNTILASTLLRFPEFIMTTGAAFPLHNINNKLESVVNKYTKDNNTFKTMSQKEKNLFIADIYKWCFSEEVFDFVNYKKFG